MTDEASQENEQFQQVLNRLDALMKRGHSGETAPPESAGPAAFPSEPPQSLQTTSPPEADIQFQPAAGYFQAAPADTEGPIPVLTDIYDGPLPTSGLEDAEARAITTDAIVSELLPVITAALDQAVEEESEKMRQALKERLPQEITAALRQFLLQEYRD